MTYNSTIFIRSFQSLHTRCVNNNFTILVGRGGQYKKKEKKREETKTSILTYIRKCVTSSLTWMFVRFLSFGFVFAEPPKTINLYCEHLQNVTSSIDEVSTLDNML